MGNLYKFKTDRINIYSLNLDKSDSMCGQEDDMIAGLVEYKNSFEGFSEANSMAIAVNQFSTNYYEADFKSTEDFRISYSTGGWTALYYAIEQGARNLLKYIKEVTSYNNCIPRATFLVFSDGASCRDKASWEDAQAAVERLNKAGVTTVFVAFGNAISSEIGEKLGFVSTKDIKDRKSLTEFMGEELSRSCKEQSKSMRSLGSEFFSKAARSQSANYSTRASQVMDDEDWFDEI